MTGSRDDGSNLVLLDWRVLTSMVGGDRMASRGEDAFDDGGGL